MATYPVKYITDTMRGAAQISGQAGTLQAALRAFLLTGFGVTTALSVTVAGGIATASLNAGQTFEAGCIVFVEGATPAQLNGEARVQTTTSNSITWATTAPDGPATGTITIKVAPVGGWEELFPGTPNKSVFRSTDPQSSGFCYRIDDSGTTQARVRGFEAMSDIDTGTGPFPTNAQINGGGYWSKTGTANSTAARYALVADSRTVLVVISPYTTVSATSLIANFRGFGDMLALAPGGDAYAAAISCAGTADWVSYGGFNSYISGVSAVYCPRPFGGIGTSQAAQGRTYAGGATAISGADTSMGDFPSPIDGALRYSRRYITASSSSLVPRAEVPGVLHIPQSGVVAAISPGARIAGTGPLAGRTLLAFGVGQAATDGLPTGINLLDITGPWR